MASVTGLTAERMLAIEAESIVGGAVNGAGHLILTKHDTTTVDAGPVIGPTGPTGPTGPGITICTSTTRPGTPAVGSFIFETNTERFLRWNGAAWVPPSNVAVGLVGYGALNADSSPIGTTQTDTGLLCVVVPPVSRKIELALSAQFTINTAGAGVIVNVKDNGTVIFSATCYPPNTTSPHHFYVCKYLGGITAVEHDYALSVATTAGTVVTRGGGSGSSFMFAKDVGGTGSAY